MKKVLIITNDNYINTSTSQYLIKNSFDVINAQNGPMGVQKTLEHTPDIILCDSDTEGFNGF
ncbi:MAG: hypothetical protein U9R54_03210, partial [Bacteroidota bacterium]|nr:hypothetical protein [Bacteroidota bacterium]